MCHNKRCTACINKYRLYLPNMHCLHLPYTAPPAVIDIITKTENNSIQITWKVRTQLHSCIVIEFTMNI